MRQSQTTVSFALMIPCPGVRVLLSCLAVPQGPERWDSKSGHLTAGHFTITTLTQTSSPGSRLPNLLWLATKTAACYSETALYLFERYSGTDPREQSWQQRMIDRKLDWRRQINNSHIMKRNAEPNNIP